ncbi:hypothetical protein GTO27_09180 [Candidatus Bathyarchaeota archaeon]|nr:hypothetical protein [Candidatus Bathyarchaeota archaeon]
MCLGLMKEQWDIAIVLDACRYDFFKQVYKEYLPSGKLEKRIGASDTFDWLQSVFNGSGTSDTIYVSAHPGINGKGVRWGAFNAKEKFYKVYDAWLSAWNWNVGSSIPDKVAKVAVKAICKHPHRKTIIHFIQPHFPYRKAPCPSTYFDLKRAKRNPKLGILLERLLRDLIDSLDINLSRFRIAYWKLKKVLRLNFLEDLNEIYWRTYSIEDLKYFYRDNLKWVLESVAKIVDRFEDLRIVITSDHGEAFGENGEFFHLYRTRNPIVRLVPFWHNGV